MATTIHQVKLSGAKFSQLYTPPVPGDQVFSTPGTFTWVAPTNVRSVSVVCVGCGGGGFDYTNVNGGGGGAGGSSAGTANTGGGGGAGFAGGSGVVVLRYPENFSEAVSITGSYTVSVSGGYRFYRFTSSGTIRF